MKTCENCGEPVYSLGCVNCNEAAYIEQQEGFDLQAEREEPKCFHCGPKEIALGKCKCLREQLGKTAVQETK